MGENIKPAAGETRRIALERLLRALLSGPQTLEMGGHLSQYGLPPNAEYRVLLLQAEGAGPARAQWTELLQELAGRMLDGPARALETPEGLALVSAGEDSGRLWTLGRSLWERLGLPGAAREAGTGISLAETGAARLYLAYRQALAAANDAAFRREPLRCYKDLGIYQLLYAVQDREVLRSFADTTLWELENYDRLHKTDYSRVLEAYIRRCGSVQQAAKDLGVHRNTVNYRIRIIRERFGWHLTNDVIARLQMAYCCRRLLRSGETEN